MTTSIVKKLKENDQDFEWYPTTQEMIDCVKRDIGKEDFRYNEPKILDCGAGDGRVLMTLTEGSRYAIEKSNILIQLMDKDIFVVGTNFEEQTLIDKNVDIIFSNPPYSVYDKWAEKIIKESNSKIVYLIIPERWRDNRNIKLAIEMRDVKVDVIGSFDFLEADRKARAKVNIVKIKYKNYDNDPFDIWFKDHFKIGEVKEPVVDTHNIKKNVKHEIVNGNDLVTALVSLYQRDMTNLLNTYKAFENVDASLLKEMDIDIYKIQKTLKERITGLKNVYWNEFFDNFNKITERLTKRSREKILNILTKNTQVDFTISNAYAIAIWVIKNSNIYINEQLIEMMERLTQKANVINYKSNQKTFGKEEWRYRAKPKELDRYSIDYRIVLQDVGGIDTSAWSRNDCGLSDSAINLFDDLCAIANTICFDTVGLDKSKMFLWDSSQKHNFRYHDIHTGENYTLFTAKAFKNGNVHMQLNQKFICRLNVEFGRLKGWIKTPKEAADELNIDIKEAVEYFNNTQQIEFKNALKLLE